MITTITIMTIILKKKNMMIMTTMTGTKVMHTENMILTFG